MRKQRWTLVGAILLFATITSAVTDDLSCWAPESAISVRASDSAPKKNVRVVTVHPVVFDPVDDLIRQLQTGDLLSRQDAAEALGKLGPIAVKAIPDLTEALKHENLCRPAALALAGIGPEGWLPLLEVLQKEDRSAPASWAVHLALERTNLRSVPDLLEDLRRSNGNYLELLRQRQADRILGIMAGLGTDERPSFVALPYLIHKLNSESWKDRLNAAESLAELGPLARPAIPALLAALEDEWPLQEQRGYFPGTRPYGVRASAVRALIAIGSAAEERLMKEGLPRIINGLTRGTDTTRQHTATALALLGARAKPAIPVLIDLIRNPNVRGNDSFSQTLAAIGPDSIPAMILLLQDREEVPRRSALSALKSLGKRAKEALPIIGRLAKDPSKYVRGDLPETLLAIDPEGTVAIPVLISMLPEEDDWVSDRIFSQLERYSSRAQTAVPTLRVIMCRADDHSAVRAAQALIHIGGPTPETTRRLIELLRPTPYRSEVHAALIASGSAALPAAPTLVNMLGSDDPAVVGAAADVLHRIGSPDARRAIPALIRGLKYGPISREHCLGTAKTLAEFGSESRDAAPRLLSLLLSNDFDSQVRWHILLALEKIGADGTTIRPQLCRLLADEEKFPWAAVLTARLDPDGPQTVPALMAVLRYPGGHNRMEAAKELGRFGFRARVAVPRLVQALEDEDDLIRYTVAASLIRVTGTKEPWADFLVQGMRHDPGAVRALADLAPDSRWAIPLLVQTLSHPDREFQSAAASSLVQFGPESREAVPALIRILKAERGREPGDRHLGPTVDALGAIGPAAKDAAPLLREMIPSTDDFTFRWFVDALKRIEVEKGDGR